MITKMKRKMASELDILMHIDEQVSNEDLDGCFPEQPVSLSMPQHHRLIIASRHELGVRRMTSYRPQFLAVTLQYKTELFSCVKTDRQTDINLTAFSQDKLSKPAP